MDQASETYRMTMSRYMRLIQLQKNIIAQEISPDTLIKRWFRILQC